MDKIKIGQRIRNIREQNFRETRELFAEKLDVTPGYLGKIERGEILVSLKFLEKLVNISGVSADYILYDNGNNQISHLRRSINFALDHCNEDELKVYSKVITTIQGYVYKITEN